jgi:hypothetical protein
VAQFFLKLLVRPDERLLFLSPASHPTSIASWVLEAGNTFGISLLNASIHMLKSCPARYRSKLDSTPLPYTFL